MAYGRLDVYWPNGDFQTFLLKTPTVSVGRSSGCTIVLETDTISRYHFSITHEGDQIFIADMDSANGTFIDGAQLDADEKRELFGGEEIQIGHLRLIYLAEDDQPTMPLDALTEDTQRFSRENIGLIVDVTEPDTGVPPGAHKSIDISITNTTDEAHLYRITVDGLPSGWGRVNRPTLRIDPDETAQVLLNIKPPRRSDSTPGDYPLTITVAREDEPEKRVEAQATASILPYHAFALGLATKTVTLYDPFRLIVHNQGSEPLPIHITGASEGDRLAFEISQPQRILQPGEKAELRGGITLRSGRRLAGGPREQSFDLLVRSQDDAGFLTATRGRFVDEAVLPPWAVYAIGGLAVSVLALLIVGLVLLLQAVDADPAIVSLSADRQEITAGTALILNWEGEEIDEYHVRVNGSPVQQGIPGSSSSTQLDTSTYADQQIEIELVGFRGDETVIESMMVNVLPPAEIVTFTVEPTQLVANVISSVTVTWEVSGANGIRLEGLRSLRRAEDVPVEVEPVTSFSGEIAVEGYAQNTFNVTLYVEDRLGQEIVESREVAVTTPTCVPAVDELTLYDFPSPDAQVVRVETNATGGGSVYPVDRTDVSGTWLRTRIDGDILVWAQRDQMTCAGFNVDSLLRLPIPTPTPAPETTADAPALPTLTPTASGDNTGS